MKITFIIEKTDLQSKINQKRNDGKRNDRIDICHQILLAILDSPLNKECKIDIYINDKNFLLKVNSKTKIPRSLHRFIGLLNQLNKKIKIKNEDNQILLQFLKKPVDNFLDPNSIKIGLSDDGKNIKDFDFKIFEEKNLIFFVNAIAKGDDDNLKIYDYTFKVSNYPLSASVAINRLCGQLESLLKIF